MGTQYRVKAIAGGENDRPRLQRIIQSAIDAVDANMSNWKGQSAISRFNASEPGRWFEVPAALASVVALGLAVGEMTHGAFDISVGDVVNAWGFGPGGRTMKPPADSVAPSTSFRDIQVMMAGPALRKATPVSLDLSGIAKGYGVDAIADALEGLGVEAYIVEIDGEIRSRGRKPDGAKWSVGLERPEVGVRRVMKVLNLETVSIATSGDYRRFFDDNGTRYSHTIDPVTGRPTKSAVVSVTVADSSCARADALATALLVMGANDGPLFAHQNEISALFLTRAKGQLIECATHGFHRLYGGH